MSRDGKNAVAVIREKKNGEVIARVFDEQGKALLDKPVNLGKVERSGDFFMEGGSMVDMFLPRS